MMFMQAVHGGTLGQRIGDRHLHRRARRHADHRSGQLSDLPSLTDDRHIDRTALRAVGSLVGTAQLQRHLSRGADIATNRRLVRVRHGFFGGRDADAG